MTLSQTAAPIGYASATGQVSAIARSCSASRWLIVAGGGAPEAEQAGLTELVGVACGFITSDQGYLRSCV
jgi:hypothetical protein